MSDYWNPEIDEVATLAQEARENVAGKIETAFRKVQEPKEEQTEEVIKA